jgi:hypothetical protein
VPGWANVNTGIEGCVPVRPGGPDFVRRVLRSAMRRTFLGLSPHNVRRVARVRMRRT